MNSFYTEAELKTLGLKKYGKNVLISRKCSIYGADNIELGNNIRIDDFCILSGRITMGSFIHIAAYTALYGGEHGVELNDFVNISSKVSIYSISDDYSGEYMTSPVVPYKYRKVTSKKVIVNRQSIIGCGCTILPGVIIAEGSAFGAMSLINSNSNAWSINCGIPARQIKHRSKKLLELEENFKNEFEV